jgi:hypothetical protein
MDKFIKAGAMFLLMLILAVGIGRKTGCGGDRNQHAGVEIELPEIVITK